MTTTKLASILSSSMLSRSIRFRKYQLNGLELIESCFEQSMPVPPTLDLGGYTGNEWQAWIVELPDALINSLTEYVIPALEACRLGKGADVAHYRQLGDFIRRAEGVVDRCRTQKRTIAKVYKTSASKQSQADAVASAQSLLQDILMLLDDLHHVAADSEEWAYEIAVRPVSK